MFNKTRSLKGKKLKFLKSISNYYDKMDIRMDEDLFAKNAQGVSKIYQEVLLLMNFLQTKPQVTNKNINYYDLFYTVTKNRDEKEIVHNQFEKHFKNFIDIVSNHYVGKKIIMKR